MPKDPLPGCRRPRDEVRPQPADAPPVQSQGFSIHKGRRAYVNPWIDVWHYDVTQPDGHSGIYGVVHFLNRVAAVVAVDSQGRVPLVGQWRVPMQAVSWEIPEGGVPVGESIQQGAQRELKEETGWTARQWQQIGAYDLSKTCTDEVGELWLAWDIDVGEPAPEPDEALSLWLVPAARAIALADDGTIRDVISQRGLLTLDRLWRAGTLPAPVQQALGPWRMAEP